MRVYRWKKPELTITVTAGGTLAANTTYYVIGYFKSEKGLSRYFFSGTSPVTADYTFTTTAVNKSVSIAWKTSGNITAFADATGGEVLVTSAKHCLTDNDEITIMGGAYAGTYDITWVSYDTFKITATWGATGTTTWECYELPNDAIGLHLGMRDSTWYNADGTQAYTARDAEMSHLAHVYGYTTTPAVVTAPYTLKRLPYDVLFLSSYVFDKSYLDHFALGVPSLEGDDTTITFQDIQDEWEAKWSR